MNPLCKSALRALTIAAALFTCVHGAFAQSAPDTSKPDPAIAPASDIDPKSGLSEPRVHHFWDRENDFLFTGVAASRILDYSSTMNMRGRGRQEIFLTNDVVDNHPAFATIEAAATGVSIGASYLFHRYRHHKLERWTSIVHLGLATSGAIRNYSLKTAHPAAVP